MSDAIKMTADEMASFLAERRMAAVATLKKDGLPHIDPLGYYFDGKDFYLSLQPDRVIVKRLRRNPNVFISVFDDAAPQAAAVQARGVAEFVPPDEELLLRVLRRYVQFEPAKQASYERSWLGKGRQAFTRELVRVSPAMMFGWDGKKTASYKRLQETSER